MAEKIRSIIIDDEKLAREIIKRFLHHHSGIENIAECSNGFEGIKKINEEKPDLIFLDIQMPKINGFEMLELIDDPPVIIFTTAFDHFALKAFEVNAADYLLKPFSQSRFDEAIEKAGRFLTDKASQNVILKGIIKHNEEIRDSLERLVVKNGSEIRVIPIEDVHYLEAQDDYVMIHCEQGKFLKQKTMKYFEDHLNSTDFVRIHRSYIAAVRCISKLELAEKESYTLRLRNDTTLPVSKTGYVRLKKIIAG